MLKLQSAILGPKTKKKFAGNADLKFRLKTLMEKLAKAILRLEIPLHKIFS